jgi:invasion protein IalB
MDVRIARGPTRWGARTLVVGLTTSMVAIAIAIGAAEFALSPPTAELKTAPDGSSADSAAQPKAAAPTAEARPPAAASQQPQLIYSPWTKVCTKVREANAQQVCFTGTVGRAESGIAVAAVLIEPEGGAKKALRVTLPLGMRLPQGTRVIVDQGQPLTAPYILCLADGCLADYEASQELIGNMKRGHGIAVQGINSQGQAISLLLSLNDFGKAYDGPPTEPKVFEAQQKKLHDQLEKRVEEVRKKVEGQQPTPR